jgi:hypothetical protein
MWSNFMEAGGWGMFPTLLFGFALVVSGGLYLLRPEARWLRVTVSLSFVVLGSGVLGFLTGCVNTLHYVVREGAKLEGSALLVVGAGFAESAHNLVLAFIFLVLTGLLATVGLVRAGRVAAA